MSPHQEGQGVRGGLNINPTLGKGEGKAGFNILCQYIAHEADAFQGKTKQSLWYLNYFKDLRWLKNAE